MSAFCECGCQRPAPLAPDNNAFKGEVKGEPRRFLPGHQRRKAPVAFVVDGASGCWEWQRAISNRGYGQLRRDGRLLLAHRAIYELLVGPIPEGLSLDHLCRNQRCINPAHLEPVTHQENCRRAYA